MMFQLNQKILQKKPAVKFMRDVTRGGLATVLNELAGMTGMGILVWENEIPVGEEVRGLCEILGFDPLHMANEGKVLFVVSDEDAPEVLEILKSNPLGTDSRIIGEVTSSNNSRVVLSTVADGKRLLDMLSGTQLPRIC